MPDRKKQRRRWLALTLIAVVVGGAGGLGAGLLAKDDQTDAFGDDFRAASARVVALGEDVREAVFGAAGKTDAQLARDFQRLAAQTRTAEDDVGRLRPPASMRPRVASFRAALRRLGDDLERIARASRRHDPEGANRATGELLNDSTMVRTARLEVEARLERPED